MNGPEVRNGTTVLRNGFIDGWMDGWMGAGRQAVHGYQNRSGAILTLG